MNINAFRRSVLVIGMLMVCSMSFAQLSEEVEKITPEFPGEVQIDFGFNTSRGKTKELNYSWWRSRSFSAYFIKPVELAPSISFRPGIGVSLEKLGQQDRWTIVNVLDSVQQEGSESQTYFQETRYDSIGGTGISDFRKSQIAINHVEIPLEFRYHFGGREKDKFFLGIGGSVAMVFESHTKVKYAKFGEMYKEKRKDDIGLSRFRYSAFGRLGVGNFGLFYKWHFHNVFTSGGPEGSQDLGYSTIGVSLSGF